MTCPSPDQLRQLAQGALDSSDLSELQAHLGSCSECAARLFELGSACGPEKGTVELRPHRPNTPRAPAPQPRLLERGESVGRYLVVDRLGAGGMGVVYAAYDPELDRRVAIKLLQASGGASEGMRANQAMLLREAQAMAKLAHPNVIAVHDVGTLDGDRVFIAMELVEGPSLRQWMDEKPRTWREVVRSFRDAGTGLAAAHAAGLVHRDFKPDNVLMGNDGRVRVMDFGLARATEAPEVRPSEVAPAGALTSGSLSTSLTQAGLLMGTPAYMAPEQFEGGAADARSDQFSFAVSLHEALYGVRPFKGRYSERPENAKWALQEPPKGRVVPAWLRRIVLRGLSVHPADRFSSMDALLDALAQDPAAKRRRFAIGAAVGAVMLAGAVVIRVADHRQLEVCRGAEQRLQHVWDPERRDAIQRAFLATRLPGAADAWARAAKAIDAYTRSWVAMRTDSCEATRLRGEQSEQVMELRMTCLDRRLGEVQALSDLLAHPDPEVVGKAVQASQALTELAGCADVSTLTARIPAPPAQDREQVEALRNQLSRGKELFDSGKVKEGIAQVEQVLTRARQLDYPPLIASALFQLGVIQAATSDKDGPRTLMDAVWTAQGVRDDETASLASAQLLKLTANMHNFDEAAKWDGLAESEVARLDHPDRLEAAFLMAHGTYLERLNRPKEAYEAQKRGLDLQRKFLSPDSLAIATSDNAFGATLDTLGREEEAVAAYQQALAIRERALGPMHPDTGIPLMNIGVAELAMGKVEDAIGRFSRAKTIFRVSSGPESFLYALTSCNEAEGLMRVGRFAEAKQDLDLSYGIWSKTQGPDSEATNLARDDLALLASFQHDWKAAQVQAQKTLALRTRSDPPDHPDLAKSLTMLGEAELGLGQVKEALGHLQRAGAIVAKNPVPPYDAAETHFALARALVENREDRLQALALARSAQRDYAASGCAVRLQELGAWLTRMGAGEDAAGSAPSGDQR